MGERVSPTSALSFGQYSTIFRTLVQIVKVLGEGGFSFVYLAQDEHSGVCTFVLNCGRVINGGATETIRVEEDTVPYRLGGCEGGDERSGSLPTIQVCRILAATRFGLTISKGILILSGFWYVSGFTSHRPPLHSRFLGFRSSPGPRRRRPNRVSVPTIVQGPWVSWWYEENVCTQLGYRGETSKMRLTRTSSTIDTSPKKTCSACSVAPASRFELCMNIGQPLPDLPFVQTLTNSLGGMRLLMAMTTTMSASLNRRVMPMEATRMMAPPFPSSLNTV